LREKAGLRPTRAIAALALCLSFAAAGLVPAGSAGAAGACLGTTDLVPQLRAFTVNQGLGSATPLARGKDALFRAYLSLPSCASSTQSIKLTGGTLTVLNGTTTLGTVAVPSAAQGTAMAAYA